MLRYTPFDPDIASDCLLGTILRQAQGQVCASYLKDAADAVVATFNVPGIDPGRIQVEHAEDRVRITIKGNGDEEDAESDRRFSFGIPRDTDPSRMTAVCRLGQLIVTLPRVQPQTRTIAVSTDA